MQSEKEIRKRRRLDAFRDRNDKSEEPPAKKLYPQEVEGMGRVLVDAPPTGSGGTGAAPAHDAPTKRRMPRRKRRRGGARRGQGAERGDEEEEVVLVDAVLRGGLEIESIVMCDTQWNSD